MAEIIFKRILVAIGVIFGVLLLCFLLFRVAAGDPAAALLGKNPRPEEVESLRREMGLDLPLFCGHWRKSDVFGVQASRLPASDIVVESRFPVPEKLLAVVRTSGGRTLKFELAPGTERWEYHGNGAEEMAAGVNFFRYQENAFNSQFAASLKELVSFKKTFPYVEFLNFGKSMVTREDISGILSQRIPVSLSLMLPVFFGETLLGIAFALLACACKNKLVDRIILVLSVAGLSISYLVSIIFCQWFFAYKLDLFPVWGWGGWKYLPLPVCIGIICGLGTAVRYYRSCFADGLNADCLRTARAVGTPAWKIYIVYLLRNTALPVIAYATAALPYLFTGSLLLESFFGIPGLGAAGVDALQNSDLQLLKALVIVSSLVFVVINLLAEFAYRWADPRLR